MSPATHTAPAPEVGERRFYVLPTSFAQRGLWFLHQLDPASPAYVMLAPFRLAGPLDPGLLRRVLDELVERHEALRTVLREIDDEPVQVVSPTGRAAFARVDLDAVPGPAGRREAHRIVGREAVRTFDLERGPLLRAQLLRLGPADHRLLVAMHHAISDGWSVDLLMREAAQLYEALGAGRPSPLAPLELQYGDFCAWQREAVAAGELDRQLDYWRRQLACAPERLDLPADRQRGAGGGRGAQRPVRLAPGVAGRLRELARERAATLYMALLAVFQALLARHAGQDALCVGSPVAGRTRREIEGVVGLFVNTLVMRGDLSGAPGFGELLTRTRETVLGALAHQDVPLEKIVEAVAPERRAGRTPLFRVLFSLHSGQPRPARLGAAAVEPIALDGGTAKFDLTLSLEELADGGVGGYLEYAVESFDAPRVERLGADFERLLAAMTAAPERPFRRLPMLAEAERRQLLSDWSGERLAHPPECVHTLFERHAAASPEAWAVASARGRLRYRELDLRANRLARLLRRHGAGPDTRVGVLFEPSIEMVVALLAALKAGAAYVPLDPTFPRERVALVLERARAVAVVTSEEHRPLVEGSGAPAIALDPAGDALAGLDGSPLEPSAVPGNVAYTIWTSGSTGRPKGVDVEHRQVVNYLHAVLARLGVGPGADYAMVQPLAVDASNTVLLPALCHGGTLHLLPRYHAMDASAVAAYFEHRPADVMKIAPSHLAALLDTCPSPALMPRRALVLGGEGSRRGWLEQQVLPRAALGSRVLIHYGPTEATVGVLTHPVTAGETRARGAWGELAPLGRPLANCAVYVLGPAAELLPTGAVGELYIGGDNVARGYYREPGLTAARFLPDPHRGEPGVRMYRTGDLARWLSDGTVEFLGRTDHQIKIRGFRIELGEVESNLLEHRGVARAVVIARERPDGDRRLIAYVVPRPSAGEPEVDGHTLRAWLAGRLPGPMVPSAVVTLPELPVSLQGKVDPRALPDPGGGDDAPDERAAPRPGTETRVAAAFEEVLDGGPVACDVDFFQLGGHSLLAVRLLGALRRRFGRTVTLADLLAAPTVARVAALIDGADAADRGDGGGLADGLAERMVRLGGGAADGAARGAPLVLVHPIGGGVACYAELARRLATGPPVDAVEARRREPRARVDAMAAAYLDRLEVPGPHRLAGWSMGGLVAFEMAAQLERRGDEVALLALIDTRPPGPPAGPPLPLLLRFAADAAGALGPRDPADDAELLRLADEAPERLREVLIDHLCREGLFGSAEEVDEAFAVFEAHARAADGYNPRPLAAPIDLVLASENDGRSGWPELWRRWAAGGVRVHVVPADHHSLLRPPAVDEVAALLAGRLAAAGRTPAGAARREVP